MVHAPKSTDILLLHGWGSSKKSWQKITALLAEKGIHVENPDMPGFGENPPPEKPWHGSDYEAWVLDFIKKNGMKTPLTIIGHSFGGGLAMKLAIDHPALVKKLVLIAAARMHVKKSLLKRLASKGAKFAKKLSFLPFYEIFRKAIYRFVLREKDYIRTSGTMRETFQNVIREDLTPHIGKIKAPTLIIWGDADKATPIEHAHLLAEQVKESKLVVIENAGHALNFESPEKVAGLISEFVQ